MKKYTNEDIEVYWYPELCSHSGKCFNRLPQVFKPKERPWVQMEGASSQEIIDAIDLCPSGALKYSLTENSRIVKRNALGSGATSRDKAETPCVKLRVLKNGPVVIDGPVEIYGFDKQLLQKGSKFTICRCGLSKSTPFCDGTHAKEGWQEEK